MTLPSRTEDRALPGFSSFPRRRLPGFDPARALVVKVTASEVRALQHRVPMAQIGEDAALSGFFRAVAESWQQRSGTAANRVHLAFGADVSREQAARVRRAAHTARNWRTVAIAKQGDDVYEVLLDPPGGRR